MAYSDNFPAVRPVFQSDFANGGRIDPRISYSRSTTGSFYGKDKHLSSENLLPYSNDVSSSEWTKSRVTVDSANNSSPDGGSDASLILETVDTGSHTYYDGFSCVSGTSYSFTVYLKANGRTKVNFKPQATSTIVNVQFDLTAVTSTVTSGSADSHSITAIGSTGWYKCAVTVTATATGTGYTQVSLVDGSGNSSYAGDVTKGIYVWGHQVSSTSETVLNATSGQIHREYAPTLQTAAINAPRFEYSPTDSASEVMGQSRGLLIEGQVTNVLPFSTNGYNASNAFVWSYDSIVSTENAAVAPSGNLEATLIRENGTTNQHNFYRLITATAAPYTYSIYVKDAGVGHVGFRLLGPASYGLVFNLSDGSTSALYNPVDSYGYEDVGNGWKRIWVTKTLTAAPHNMMIYLMRGNGSVNYAGDNYSGLLWYGAQIEQSSFPSSYTDTGTSGSTVTRAADSASIAVSDITGFSEGVGTIVCETGGVASATEDNQLAFGLRADSTNFFTAGVNNGGVTDTSVRVYSKTSDGDQAYLNIGTATVGTGYKLACRYELDNIASSLNGGTVVSDTSGKVPVGIDTLWLGQSAGNYHLNSNLKRLALYGEALSDTNLQALTK